MTARTDPSQPASAPPHAARNASAVGWALGAAAAVLWTSGALAAALPQEDDAAAAAAREFTDVVQPLLTTYCAACHGAEAPKGDLDLAAFTSLAAVRAEPLVWREVEAQLEDGAMPPRAAPQPSEAERATLQRWLDATLGALAREQAGDPGPVVLRRLSNAEYTYTVRDLLGLESLDPVREFPVDGAAGEGFTNVGDALVMSPSLLSKYLAAAKGIAEHAVLLPDGLGFSPSTTRRDWTEEALGELRAFYRHFTAAEGGELVDLQGIVFQANVGGRLPVGRYLAATLELRGAVASSGTHGEPAAEVARVAQTYGLSPRYLAVLDRALRAPSPPSPLLRPIVAAWRNATEADVPALAARIAAWQAALWRFNTVGHLGKVGGPTTWLEPVDVLARTRTLPLGFGVAVHVVLGDPADPAATPRAFVTVAHTAAAARALDDFRALFPAALCYEQVVPVDEVVTLTQFHREDTHLARLVLSEAESATLDRLWQELRFVSEDALTQVDAFEQLWQYATQDADPSVFEPLRAPIAARAAAFRAEQLAAEPRHVDALLALAARAYRRPLELGEGDGLRALYSQLRSEGLTHDAAVRLVLARILVAPAFLYHPERPAPSTGAAPVSDHELASRLSYFLWSSLPDAPLLASAARGTLHDPAELVAHTRRMLRDPRVRRLAVEFGCAALHIHGFDERCEKSERHFPTFAGLRGAMYEESVLFLTDLFQRGGSVLELLTADHTFLNGALAEHYGVPGVVGDTWQRVEGMRARSRGGILGHASTLATQAGAARTSPILRGNWVSEVLLGERLPRPPKDVPPLPEDEGTEELTMRALTERHTSDERCASCHARIDPLGFALERFDAVGRWRDVDAGGRPLDTRVRTLDGAEFDGLDGLRQYVLGARRDAFVRQFCRKLLGYSLGRGVLLSDEPLLDTLVATLTASDHSLETLVEAIVLSSQFRDLRGLDAAHEGHTERGD